jgi:hypothetical protein
MLNAKNCNSIVGFKNLERYIVRFHIDHQNNRLFFGLITKMKIPVSLSHPRWARTPIISMRVSSQISQGKGLQLNYIFRSLSRMAEDNHLFGPKRSPFGMKDNFPDAYLVRINIIIFINPVLPPSDGIYLRMMAVS